MTLDDLKFNFSAVAKRRAIETGRPLGEVARELAEELVLAMRVRTGRPGRVAEKLSDWGYVNAPTLDALRVFVAERIAGGGENDVNWAAAQVELDKAKPGCRLAQVLPNDQLELLVARRWLCDHWPLHGGDYGSINQRGLTQNNC